jgi:hypothetical protein
VPQRTIRDSPPPPDHEPEIVRKDPDSAPVVPVTEVLAPQRKK